MKKYSLFIGLNDKDTKVQRISTVDAFQIVARIVGDATITENRGVYTHDSGVQVVETSFCVQKFDFDGNFDLKKAVEDIKRILNQESVAVVIEDVNSVLM